MCLYRLKFGLKICMAKEKAMENKKFWMGMLVLTLALGMMVIGCETDPKDEADTWTDVTELSQLNGTWKGSYSETETENGLTVKTTMEMTITINATAQTMSGSMKMTMAFSGTGVAEAWSMIKEEYEGDDITFNDSNHSISMTQTIPSMPLSQTFDMEDVQINQNGKKIKTLMGDEGPELILVKQ